jgi:PEP-CTERM motif-containing protein
VLAPSISPERDPAWVPNGEPLRLGGSMNKVFLLASFILASPAAYAGVGRLPEPGTFELLALGGVVALVIGIRNRRKK